MKELKMNIKGMVCEGCEKRVVNCLSAEQGVNEVLASHQNGTVVVKGTEEMDIELLKKRIIDLGFEVKED